MSLQQKVNKLEASNMSIKLENVIIKKEVINPHVPIWAQEAYESYKNAGFNYDERGHSNDFYRIITLLHQNKLL